MITFRQSSLLAGIAIASIALAASAQAQRAARRAQAPLRTRSAPIIEQGGYRFRDLDRNGKVDPYEDWRLTPAARARDLVARMTLEEKAGAMMHGIPKGKKLGEIDMRAIAPTLAKVMGVSLPTAKQKPLF